MSKAGMPAAIGGEQRLTHADAIAEFMLNALRLTDGFPAALFAERTGLAPDAIETDLRHAEQQGFITRNATAIRPTEQGQRFLNNLIELFI